MDCVYCDGKASDSTTNYRLVKDDLKVTIKDVPSYRCSRCRAVPKGPI